MESRRLLGICNALKEACLPFKQWTTLLPG